MKKHSLLHIGMRKSKSILAVFVGFCLWQLIRIPFPELEVHPLFIYTYGILEIRDSSEKTVTFSKRRIKATFTAILVGFPVIGLHLFFKTLVLAYWPGLLIETGLLMLGILASLCVAELVGCENFCGLAAAMFVIFYVSHANSDPLFYALMRVVQTMIGISIAWLINVKLFPYKGKSNQ